MVENNKKASVVYFGTPEFAVPALEHLARLEAVEVHAVVTQPDKPAGRGLKLRPPAVKVAAENLGIPIFQPKSIKTIELEGSGDGQRLLGQKSNLSLVEFLNSIAPIDIFICVAYGKFIPNSLLTFAQRGMLNIHPSLLPRWRGPGPLQQALFSGDEVTGVTLMEIDDGMDSGPIFSALEVPIEKSETLGSLHDKMADIGAELLVKELPNIISGELTAKAQAESGMTYAAKWEVADTAISWKESADVTVRRINTCTPIPGARTNLNESMVKLFAAATAEDQNFPAKEAGTVVECNREELIIAAGEREFLSVSEVQFPGKKRLSVKEVYNGGKISTGDIFKDYSIESQS